jgi:hypothetical protein
MPLQNRVTPDGEIIAHPARGQFMGNRGCLHDDRTIVRRWNTRLWITCLTSFAGRRRPLMTPGRYTELFFLDEAVALAAGHRPCAECRRGDFERYVGFWCEGLGGPRPRPPEIDATLERARVDRRAKRQVTFEADLADLPDGSFIRHSGETRPLLVLGDRLFPYDPVGYDAPLERSGSAKVTVLTPRPNLAVLAAGYRPVVHPSAAGAA